MSTSESFFTVTEVDPKKRWVLKKNGPRNTRLFEMYKNGTLSDVTLLASIDGARVLAHRFWLAYNSDYFHDLLGTDPHGRVVFPLAGVTGTGLKLVIDSCYLDEISLDSENIVNVMNAAACLGFHDIEGTCRDILVKHTSKIFAIGKVDEESISIEKYSRLADRWIDVESISGKRLYSASTSLDSELIISGGWDGERPLDSVFAMDINTCHLRHLKSMHTARNGHCCAVLDGMLYVIGGFDAESKPLASVEKYDQAKDEWTIVESLNIARGNAAVAVMNGALYVAGGQSNGLEASVECYHPGKNEWFTIYSMAENRSQFGLTELNGYLYAIGGLSRNIERYDPCTNSWSTIASLDSIRLGACMQSHGEKLILIGGYNGVQFLDRVDEYDLKTNSWKSLKSMGKNRCFFSVASF